MWARVLMGLFTLLMIFIVLDQVFGLREAFSARSAAYRRPTGESDRDRRLEAAIRYRIAVLLRPRDTTAGIGKDPSARLIEAGLLYGRLALLQESQGRMREKEGSMAHGVSLLKEAGHRDPTEAHIRLMIGKQDAAAQARKSGGP